MTREVNITASEELALMIEYTTGESKRVVQRLHNAYAENPAAGIRESWKKYGEHFRSTAVVTLSAPEQASNVSSTYPEGQERTAGIR